LKALKFGERVQAYPNTTNGNICKDETMNIIVFDTETTGLLAPVAGGVDNQPYLVEFYAIKMNRDFEPIDKLTFRCKPPIMIPEDAIKIHHISNNDVANCERFIAHFTNLAHFFLGTEVAVGHNLMFDTMVLHWELVRAGKQLSFPWPIRPICTAEISSQQMGYRQNLTDLHTELFGIAFEGAHSASSDCETTAKCFIEMVNRGMIPI
jgi:DNA polymerase III subunit epsilon